jgi:hypothetical protein
MRDQTVSRAEGLMPLYVFMMMNPPGSTNCDTVWQRGMS